MLYFLHSNFFENKITIYDLLKFSDQACKDDSWDSETKNKKDNRGVVFSVRIGLKEYQTLNELFDKFPYLTRKKQFSLLIMLVSTVVVTED